MYSYIFDIGGVLIPYDCQKIIDRLSVKTKCERINIERLFHHDLLYQVETDRISSDNFYKTHVCAAMPGLSYEDWLLEFVEHYSINPPGVELLQYLKEKGRKVYILSNLAEFHKVAIDRKIPQLFGMCNKCFFSYELGYHKPERQIYEQVCKSIGEKPESCVFLDDIKSNVEGAQSAGLVGIHFSNDNIEAIRKRVLELEEST
jgi:putative hydrolase of the HAD superfamily